MVRVFSRLNIGGPSVHVILLTAGLDQRGYRTRLVVGQEARHEGNMLPLAEEKGVVCEPMAGLGREIRIVSDFRAFWGLYRLIRDFQPAIVHTHTAKAGLLGRLAARLAGVPVVVVHTFHGHVLRGYFGPAKTAFFRWLETGLARLSDVLIAVSEAVKQDLVDLGVAPSDRIRVVPLGLELDRLAGPLPKGALRVAGLHPLAPLIGMIGRLVPIKDVPTFLAAAALVRKARPDSHFALVGDGEERSLLEEACRNLGLFDVVHFYGWRRDLAAVYGDLDVVVNTSRNEGTPVALIEALAAGRPVVATRVGGTPDLLGHGAYGLLVPPADPEALAAAVLEALSDPASARARAEAGRDRVLARYSSSRLIEDMDALYRELLARRSMAA